MTADAHLPHDVGVGLEADRLVDERRVRARRRQVDEHAGRIRQPLVVKRHLAVEVDDDPHRVG